MKFTTMMICFLAASSFAQSSANQIEKDFPEISSVPAKNAWNFSNSFRFETNTHNVHQALVDTSDPIHSDIFLYGVGLSKKFEVGNILGFATSVTPNAKASFFDTTQGKDSDNLRDADGSLNMEMMKVTGAFNYGLALNTAYHYGYTYRLRNNTESVLTNFRRNDNNASAGLTLKGDVAINDNFIVKNSVGYTYFDHSGVRLPNVTNPNDADYGDFVGDTYDRDVISAMIDSQFIINKNLSVSIPLNFQRIDYKDYNAYVDVNNAAALNGENRLLEISTAGVRIDTSVNDTLEFSISTALGRFNDKASKDAEDADMGITSSSMKLKFTEDVSLDASHAYEFYKYDRFAEAANERIQTYSFGVGMNNIAGLPVDGSLTHAIYMERSNYATGVLTNNTTSLNLNYKL
jgi:hypothetical protein